MQSNRMATPCGIRTEWLSQYVKWTRLGQFLLITHESACQHQTEPWHLVEVVPKVVELTALETLRLELGSFSNEIVHVAVCIQRHLGNKHNRQPVCYIRTPEMMHSTSGFSKLVHRKSKYECHNTKLLRKVYISCVTRPLLFTHMDVSITHACNSMRMMHTSLASLRLMQTGVFFTACHHTQKGRRMPAVT